MTTLFSLKTCTPVIIPPCPDGYILIDPCESVSSMATLITNEKDLADWCGHTYGDKTMTCLCVGSNHGIFPTILYPHFKNVMVFDHDVNNRNLVEGNAMINQYTNLTTSDICITPPQILQQAQQVLSLLSDSPINYPRVSLSIRAFQSSVEVFLFPRTWTNSASRMSRSSTWTTTGTNWW